MNRTLLLMAIAGLLTLAACERTTDSPGIAPDYYQLKTGNYWIYENQMLENDTLVQTFAEADSLFVEKDTLINNIRYFKLRETFHLANPVLFVRDSLGYLVDKSGNVYFSSTNTSDTVEAYTVHNIVRVAYTLDKRDSLVTVPAGTFNCKLLRGTLTALNPNLGYTTKTQGIFRAAEIGQVETITVNAGGGDVILRKRLLRYHIGK